MDDDTEVTITLEFGQWKDVTGPWSEILDLMKDGHPGELPDHWTISEERRRNMEEVGELMSEQFNEAIKADKVQNDIVDFSERVSDIPEVAGVYQFRSGKEVTVVTLLTAGDFEVREKVYEQESRTHVRYEPGSDAGIKFETTTDINRTVEWGCETVWEDIDRFGEE